jgi:hypothetical protein
MTNRQNDHRWEEGINVAMKYYQPWSTWLAIQLLRIPLSILCKTIDLTLNLDLKPLLYAHFIPKVTRSRLLRRRLPQRNNPECLLWFLEHWGTFQLLFTTEVMETSPGAIAAPFPHVQYDNGPAGDMPRQENIYNLCANRWDMLLVLLEVAETLYLRLPMAK